VNTLNLPTVFHITHPKAGSQWVAQVLRECAPHRFVAPQIDSAQFYDFPIRVGGIYPALYLGWRQFEALRNFNFFDPLHYVVFYKYIGFSRLSIIWQNWKTFTINHSPHIKFVVIRDLRDMFVSLYFSLKYSHPILTVNHKIHRDYLNNFDMDAGLLYLMREFDHLKTIQIKWQNKDARFFKYEDLVADEVQVFQRIIDYCQIEINPGQLIDIILRNSFKSVTGRDKGQEVEDSHHRKAIVGDWRNHFSDHVKAEFKRRFGDVLIATGYEKDLNW